MVDNPIYEDLENIGQKIRKRRNEPSRELSKVDKEISDIHHYIEFYSLSASRGYKMAKILKDCLIQRRAIKDETEMLNRISVMTVGHIGNGKGRRDLDKLNNKQYTPRILTELFEGD